MATIIAAALVVTGGVVWSTPASAAEVDRAVVVRVVDGDTLIVKLKGKQARVRLLNVDTPETKDPNEPVECLGPEASAYLTKLLPKSAQVTLKYDEDRYDRYGRTLAAVFTDDKKFVSEEIARRGLGMAVKFGDNVRYFKTVQAAQAQAKTKSRGLYSETIECTVPARVAALKGQMAALTGADSATAVSADVSVLVAHSATIIAGTSVEKAALAREAAVVKKAAEAAAAAAAAAAQAEAAAAAAAAAAEEEAAAAAQAAAAARAAADERTASVPAPVTRPPSSGNVDKYTGCRAYGPQGTSSDDKGRRYTKIPC